MLCYLYLQVFNVDQENMQEGLREVEIVSVEEIADKVYILEFERFFEFEAGQIIKLAWPGEAKPRLYSIASGEKQPNIQILFNVVGEGQLTPMMAGMRHGDKILASMPLGKFTGTGGPAWWIAQGTGIAPFASMLRSGQTHNKTLIHGGRYHNSFYYQDEFIPMLGERYIRCSSKDSGDSLYHGRVTDYLKSIDHLPVGPLYYLCGSAEMVVETRDILIEKGVGFGEIVSEIYF
ncbi:MAG TPA: oxidoreductase [Bacteroidales bacterium]|nr:oxidoreductase [Bacteroidales bacterium]